MSGKGERLGAGRYVTAAEAPESTTTSLHELTTPDDAKVSGVLRTVPGAGAVVSIMHPRQDVTHHVLVPILLRSGFAVWTQGTRSVNNDLSLLHEQALLDAAAGLAFLRDSFEHVIVLGHSGGGTLYAYYIEQAGLPPGQRAARTPSGRPVDLPGAKMPLPDGAVFLAPHPGQGQLLLRCIDPSVTDESDPLSVDPALDPYDTRNGFAEPPATCRYSEQFLADYRAAQRDRVARIDARAREAAAAAAEARARYKATGLAADRRRALAPRLITVYRTDADPRTVDLSLDPSERPYGSVFGARPDLINYGLVGFGRLSTPDAWLSTWSALSSRASFLRCAPAVTVPALFVELTGDQAAFPSDSRTMAGALGAADTTRITVRGLHFGGPIGPGEPPGAELAGAEIGKWLATRFSVA
jgi:hypothetical protein